MCTNDADIGQAVRSLRQYGWNDKYRISRPGGRNSRLDEVQAAILRRRLPLLDEANDRRRAVHGRYAEALAGRRIFGRTEPSFVAHLAVVDVPDREAARAQLEQAGIGTDVHYPVPDHLQAVEAPFVVASGLPVTEELSRHILTVPCFPELSEDEVSRVCEVLSTW